jgi:tRNA U34 5-carboxymethylaminomethyl modifying GTPase MnmE/TrmE
MATDAAAKVAEAVHELIRAETGESYYSNPNQEVAKLAESIDELLKNLLLAKIDKFLV